ncbi:carbohydrate ABC transporter permease [Paenibacillus psychroresistens]|uniref:Carbohydrate ABC transporter permease n=1 Tax=Paenibacillus psychroresistens TaxID=1778678 RepID=A0A6B8RHU0_9BACL|nr:carbohydrate ABC transporter permease [Paenibacillus psychroresistens]QGQ95103.1 carbohydrate ABC transporter permease [Paenibacillus psychroresistens]
MRISMHAFRLYLLEIVMLILSLIYITPLIIMVLTSLKTSGEADAFNLKWPTKWMFSNYVDIFEKANLVRSLLNSVFITVTTLVIVIVFSSMAAFIIARVSNKRTKSIYYLFSMGLFVPLFLITTIAVNKFLHINGTYLGIILVYVSTTLSWSVFLYTGFIKGIPRELDESAIVEGCGSVKLFFRIIFPLLLPVTATNVIVLAITIWNDFLLPLFLLNNSKQWTITLSIYGFFGQYSRDWNLVCAVLVVTLAPITILYFSFQKYVIEGMTAGAVKG